MPNIGDKISAHNKQILEGNRGTNGQGNPIVPPGRDNCNCRIKTDCPLEGECLSESIIYKATVDNKETYIGLAGGTFKQRFTAHKASFRHSDRRNDTQLSKYVWEMKDQGLNPTIKWEILDHAPSYTPTLGRCILCLKEKEKILYFKEQCSLNSRNEIISHCRHRRKYLLL